MENLLFLGVPIFKHFRVISTLHKNCASNSKVRKLEAADTMARLGFISLHLTVCGFPSDEFIFQLI